MSLRCWQFLRILAIAWAALALVPTFGFAADNPVERKFRAIANWKSDVDDLPLFRQISRVAIDSQHRLLVLDARSLVIHSFDASGAYLGEIALGGEGPGELSSIVDFTLDADDNILALSPFGPSVVDIRAAWSQVTTRKELIAPGIGPSTGFSIGTHGDRVLVWSFGSMGDKQAVMLMSTPRNLRGPVTVLTSLPADERSVTEFSEKDYLFGNYRPWCVSTDGYLFAAAGWSSPGDQYEIHRYGPNGARDSTFGGARRQNGRTRDEVRRAEELLMGGPDMVDLARRSASGDPIRMADTNPDVTDIFEFSDEIWVHPYEPVERRDHSWRFDAFTKDGRPLGAVRLRVDGYRADKDRLFVLRDRVVVVKGMVDMMLSSPLGMVRDADPLQVICARIVEGDAR